MRRKRLFFYCSGFPNYGSVQAIVCASTPFNAQKAAWDTFYGKPQVVRVASLEELDWHRSFGGQIIYT